MSGDVPFAGVPLTCIMAQIRHPGHRSNDGSAYAEDAFRAEGGGRGRWLGVWSSAPASKRRAAHNAVYAWICKPILAAGQAPGLRLHQLAPMAYRVQHQGLVLSRTGSPAIDVPFGWVEEIGRQLSERSCATASAVAGRLSQDVLARLLLSDTLADATRLLEAASRLPPVTAEPANRRFEHPPSPTK
jgi:hypothetical protein